MGKFVDWIAAITATLVGGVLLHLFNQRMQQPKNILSGDSSALCTLANLIYQKLRRRVPRAVPYDALITYSSLVTALGKLPPPNDGLTPYDERLFDALGEITKACRARGLPTLTGLVVTASDRKPGRGYYPEAHPGVGKDPVKQLAAWEMELALANQTMYPPSL